MKKISLTADEALTAAFPRHRSSRVTIVMNSGQAHEYYAQDRKGDPECPLDDNELNDKYDELVTPVLGARLRPHSNRRSGCLKPCRYGSCRLADAKHNKNFIMK